MNTAFEKLREWKRELENGVSNNEDFDKNAYNLIEQYDMALENTLLKLKNRGVEISDLKHRIKELRTEVTRLDEAMRHIVNYAINTPLDKRLSLPPELFATIDKALARYKQKS